MVNDVSVFAHNMRNNLTRWRLDLAQARERGDSITAEQIQHWLREGEQLLGDLAR